MRTTRLGLSCLLALLLGCGDEGAHATADTGTGSTGPDDSTSSSGDTSGSPADTGSDSATHGAESSESGFQPADPECGNGYVEGDEQCDDGNAVDDDECSNACKVKCGLEWSQLVEGPTADSPIAAQQVARGTDDAIVVAGYTQEVTTDQRMNQTVGPFEIVVHVYEADGRPRWNARLHDDDDLRLGGVATDTTGDVYVALTRDTSDGGSDIDLVKLAAADGLELWTHTFDSPIAGSKDQAFGVDVASDGSVVISGQNRAGDGDDDVWVRGVDAATGDALWTSTWSGQPNGNFSTENGGPLALDGDDNVWVFAEEYVSFDTQPATLLRFPAGGGTAEVIHRPAPGGTPDDVVPLDVAIDEAGDAWLAYAWNSPGQAYYYVEKVSPDGTSQWVLDESSWATRGDDWLLSGLALTPGGDVVIGGSYEADDGVGGTWIEGWYQRLDPQGNAVCRHAYQGPTFSLMPVDILVNGVGSGPDGGAIMAGQQNDEGTVGLWVGAFRSQ